jgi:transketolase
MTVTARARATSVLERGRPVSAEQLRRKADWIRLETIRLIAQAGLGHYSSTFSCAEAFAVLYYHSLRLDPADPSWPERDRFLLGKGHVAVGLWPVLADLGYFPTDWLDRYGSLGSPLTDHPDMRKVPGVDFSSGSLGHNLSVGVGMALAERLRHSDVRVYVLTGDGELQEGQVWEAAMSASHYRLGNLVAILDANGYSGGGATSATMNIEPLTKRFEAFGWAVQEVDGNDVEALVRVLDALPEPSDERPMCIVSRTAKGKGLAAMEASPQAWHLGCMTEEERVLAVAEIEARLAR